jgi:hypothetical protein
MNRWHFLALLLALPTLVLIQGGNSLQSADAPYQPAVPAGNVVSPYGSPYAGCYGGGGGRVAGSALNGMSNVISAQGQRTLANSAAAVNMTQARKNEIQNRQAWTDTYFAMREENRRVRAAERGPNPTPEQIAQIAKSGVPKPLTPSELDPVSGKLFWPGALQLDSFEAQRSQVDELFAVRARYGALSYTDQVKARTTINDMYKAIKAQVNNMPSPDYMLCRSFLGRLMYAATGTQI